MGIALETSRVTDGDTSPVWEEFLALWHSDESQRDWAKPVLDQPRPGCNSGANGDRAPHREVKLAHLTKLARLWPVATRGEELVPRSRSARECFDVLVRENTPLPIGIARFCVSQFGPRMEFDDLFQEGLIGLMSAIAKFDPDLTHSFNPYANKYVYYSIVRAIDNAGSLIRVPVEVAENLRRAERAQMRASLGIGRPLRECELARELALTVEGVRQLSRVAELNDVEPLESGISVDESSVSQSPLEAVSEHSLQRGVTRVLSKLRPLEERLLRMRFGIPFGDNQSLNEICACLGISREKAGLVESKALRHLRHAKFARGLRSFVA